MIKRLTKASLVLTLAILALWSFYAFSKSDAVVQASGKKPVFTLKNLDGDAIALSDYRGKVVMVNVWATWCATCLKEIPDIVKLRNAYHDKSFEVLGLVVTSPRPLVQRTIKRFDMSYPVLVADDAALVQLGDVQLLPQTFILNTDGDIVDQFIGIRSYAFFEKIIQKYLPNDAN